MKTPRIVSAPYGLSPLANQSKIGLMTTAEASSHSVTNTAIGIGSWLTYHTDAVKNLAMASAEASASYVVTGIFLADGVTPKRNQYLTATEAGADTYLVSVLPIGGLVFDIEEDGDGGLIASWSATPYCDLVVTAPATDIAEDEKTVDGVAAATATIKIDSSSANASNSGLLCEIIGMSDISAALIGQGTTAAYSTGTGKVYRVKVIAACATYSQG